MCEAKSDAARIGGPAPETDGRPVSLQALPPLCVALAEIGVKLDRLEDALHDLTQVLARVVGPPWDITGN
jgi:hypothetical protein